MRLGAVTAVALASHAAGGCSRDQDHAWRVAAINGRPVEGYSLRVDDRRITGGRDGCNAWGVDPDRKDMIISDAQECLETAERRAY